MISSSNEYISGIKSKREWITNCPYSELKSLIQSISIKINKFEFESDNYNQDEILVIIKINGGILHGHEKSLESQFKYIKINGLSRN